MFELNQVVRIKHDKGRIRFIGATEFAPGKWYGVELDLPNGKNNGVVQGKRYFECSKPGLYGIFVRESMMEMIHEEKFPAIIEKLQTKLKKLTIETSQYKGEVEKFDLQLKAQQETIVQLENKIEMQSVDNDFLTMTKSQLEEKVQLLNSEYCQLQSDFKLLQEELSINNELNDEMRKVDVDQLTKDDIALILDRNQNFESLLDQYQQNEIELNKQLEHLKSELKKDAKTETELKQSEDRNKLLLEKIESFENLETLIENLTLENGQLNKTIAQLNNTIMELQEINELDKRLEEDQKLFELDLKNEIESLKSIIEKDKMVVKETKVDSENHGKSSNQEIQNRLLKSEVVQLKDELAKNEIRLKILQQRCSVLQERCLINAAGERLLDLMFQLKMKVSDSNVLLEFMNESSNDEIYCKYLVESSQSYIQRLLTMIEYNFQNEALIEGSAVLIHMLDSMQFDELIYLEDLSSQISLLLKFVKETRDFLFNNDAKYHYKEVLHYNSILQDYRLNVKYGKLLIPKEFNHTVIETDLDFTSEVTLKHTPSFSSLVDEVYNLQKEDIDKSDSKLEQLLNDFNSLRVPEFEKTFKNYVSVYDSNDHRDISKDTKDNEVLSTLISQKDTELKDLKLNINLLEQNMKLLSSQNLEILNDWKHKYKTSQLNLQDQIDKFQILQQEKLDLQNQLRVIEKNSLQQNAFKDIKSQQNFNDQMNMVERYIDMKQKFKIVSLEDLSWMNSEPKKRLFQSSLPVQEISNKLRTIANSIKPVLIQTNFSLHNKQKLQNLADQEKYVRYKSVRNHYFRDLRLPN